MKKIIILLLLTIFISSCISKDDTEESTKAESNNSESNLVVENNKVIEGDVEMNTEEEVGYIEEDDEVENNEDEDEIVEEEIDCGKEYDNLLSKYKGEYSTCTYDKANLEQCGTTTSDKPKINVIILFDSSGSMGNYIGEETMMDIAKEKVSDYISEIEDSVNLSFIVYGHKGTGKQEGKTESCEGIEEIHSFSDTSTTGLLSKVSNFKPTGRTAITGSLQKAKAIIKEKANENDKNVILLISDGAETCGNNPAIEAFKISKGLKNTYVDVIGFNVEGDTQKQLIDIAKKGGGSYTDVKSRVDFENVFNKTKNFLGDMTCGANKAANELGFVMKGINKYYECYSIAREEQTYIMVDAHEECKDEIQTKVEIRFENKIEEFENIKTTSMEVLDNFNSEMERIIENMDE